MVLSVAEIAWVRLAHGVFDLGGAPEFLVFFFWMAQYGSLSLAVMYAVLSIAGLFGLWNESNRSALVIAVVVALVVTGLAIFSAVYKVPSPFDSAIWWFLGWVAIRVVILIVQIATNRFRVSAQGAGALTVHTAADEQIHPEF